MRKISKMFLDSLNELKDLKNVVLCGLFAAIAVALGFFSIMLGGYIRIGFSTIPNQAVSAMFGPSAGSIFASIADILKYFTNPQGGAFFPGYTLSAFLAGLIYGIIYYKKKLTIWRILIAQLIVAVFINLGLNTLWIAMTMDKGFLALIPGRVLKNIIMWPIDSVIFFSIMKAVEQVLKSYRDI